MKESSFAAAAVAEIRPVHGLSALLADGGRVSFPLRSVDVRFDVVGDLAQVVLQQEFEHDGSNAVDVVYAFPLPDNAVVHECVMSVGERKVAARVLPSSEAQAAYEGGRRDRKRVMLVEALRHQLFELRLGNVQAGDGIRIDFSYAMPLVVAGVNRELRIPLCPGVRFSPGLEIGADGGTDRVPDAGRLALSRIDAGHPDAATFYGAGRIEGASELESPTHGIEQNVAGDGVLVTLDSNVECPDRDFVLTWKIEGPSSAIVSSEDPLHVLCPLVAPYFDSSRSDGRDILFLLDSSGSMRGPNWIGVLDFMELSMGWLRPSDRFCVKSFDDEVRDFTAGWQAPGMESRNDVMARLRTLRASGGKQFTQGFASALAETDSVQRPVIIVVTDGQIGDEGDVLRLVSESDVEVHTVGMDSNPNVALLRKIARANEGTCHIASPGQDLNAKVCGLMDSLLTPWVRMVQPAGEWALLGEPPTLREAQSVLVALRRKREGVISDRFEIEWLCADGSKFRQELGVRSMKGPAVSALAYQSEIEALIGSGCLAEGMDLASHRNIYVKGSALFAWDGSQDIVGATASIEQANLIPGTPDSGSAAEDGGTFAPRSEMGCVNAHTKVVPVVDAGESAVSDAEPISIAGSEWGSVSHSISFLPEFSKAIPQHRAGLPRCLDEVRASSSGGLPSRVFDCGDLLERISFRDFFVLCSLRAPIYRAAGPHRETGINLLRCGGILHPRGFFLRAVPSFLCASPRSRAHSFRIREAEEAFRRSSRLGRRERRVPSGSRWRTRLRTAPTIAPAISSPRDQSGLLSLSSQNPCGDKPHQSVLFSIRSCVRCFPVRIDGPSRASVTVFIIHDDSHHRLSFVIT